MTEFTDRTRHFLIVSQAIAKSDGACTPSIGVGTHVNGTVVAH